MSPAHSTATRQFTVFIAEQRIGQGPLGDMLRLAKGRFDDGERRPIWIFDDLDGRPVEVNYHIPLELLLRHWPARYEKPQEEQDEAATKRGPGRPKLGVVAREVTLLPRHWEWLNAQPGGASVALRKLVEQARRDLAPIDRKREAQERSYRVLSTLAGDAPAFEEALRALYAGDQDSFAQIIALWPADIAEYTRIMAAGCFD